MKNINIDQDIYFLENKDFKTIQIRVLFPFEEKTDDLAKIALLPNMLTFMNEEYPTEEAFQLEKKRQLILGTGCFKSIIGTTGAFCFDLVIPDTSVVGEGLLEKQISFLEKMIYHPKITDGCFDNFEFEREKRNLELAINSSSKNMGSYLSFRLREIIDDYGILSREIMNHRYLIDEVTSKDLYEYYLDNIKNNNPVIFVMGNIDKNYISNLLGKYLLKKEFRKRNVIVNYNYFLGVRDKVINIEEKSIFKDSSLSFIYKVKDMSEDDFKYLSLLKALLSSLSSRLLGKKLRDECDLIYSSRVNLYMHYGVFEITVFINKNNKDLVKEKLIELINDLKNSELIAPLLENIKERRRINLLKDLDQKFLLFDDFIFNTLDISKTQEELYQEILEISAKDLALFVEKLVLDTIYFLEEEAHE